MKLVDAHFHLDLHKSPAAVVTECESQGIYTIAVTNAPSVFHYTQQLASTTEHIRAALGLHPELVASHAHELPDLLRLMDQTRYIGEVGLDYVTSDAALRRKQRDVFETILKRCAEFGDRILTVHSRRAATDVLACIGRAFPGTVILHWFSGNKRDLLAGLDVGCYYSVNPAMLRSKRGRALISDIPPDRLLTETDGPFVEVNGLQAVPSDARYIVEGVARLWSVEPSRAALTILSNFRNMVDARRNALGDV